MRAKAAIPFEPGAPQITLVAGTRYQRDLPDLQCRLWTIRPSLRGGLPQDFCAVSFVRGRYCVWRRSWRSRVLRACPSLDTRECKTGSLHKSAKAGSVTADDKGLHLDGALVGDQRLHIAEVPHHMEVKTVCPPGG
jgi:hypothetical protein